MSIGVQRTARPTFFAFARTRASSLRCAHGLACSPKAASHNSTMDGRGQLVLHHYLTASRVAHQSVPIRYRQRFARRREVQHEIFVWHCRLAANGRSAACDHCRFCVHRECGRSQELDEGRSRKTSRGGNAIFRSHLRWISNKMRLIAHSQSIGKVRMA